MNYHLAQLNIARFRLPMEYPINAPFIESLDHVNSTAEQQPGFVFFLNVSDALRDIMLIVTSTPG